MAAKSRETHSSGALAGWPVFPLIELVIVIVIPGILAVTASAPVFSMH